MYFVLLPSCADIHAAGVFAVVSLESFILKFCHEKVSPEEIHPKCPNARGPPLILTSGETGFAAAFSGLDTSKSRIKASKFDF